MLGFIGTGNMATAMIEGILRREIISPEDIVLDRHRARAQELHERLGVRLCDNLEEMVELCEMLVLAVKPGMVEKVLTTGVRDKLVGKAVLSIAAGWTTERLVQLLPGVRVLRVMPNTPALVGEGMTALSREHLLKEEESEQAEHIFSALGRIVWVEESMMEAVTGVSGSGPAYAFLFLEAMADGGVLMGLPRKAALELAAQTLVGAAKMVLESKQHPGELKDMVCSPGGTTISAVRALEKSGFRSAVIEAVAAATEKAQAMKG